MNTLSYDVFEIFKCQLYSIAGLDSRLQIICIDWIPTCILLFELPTLYGGGGCVRESARPSPRLPPHDGRDSASGAAGHPGDLRRRSSSSSSSSEHGGLFCMLLLSCNINSIYLRMERTSLRQMKRLNDCDIFLISKLAVVGLKGQSLSFFNIISLLHSHRLQL